ncbi:ZIP family metal transporter [Pseudidiomarina terrestris]|uniref:ZIP family metal transporter n=1 Tax=Pseudidiomarina terrestris TaxID=2820060 RepID=A0AAW7QWP4_9GAMM|nr:MULTISPECIES: ZIP family metal transporter [unclassified Pseudidiomarina]MDN7124640.1 ZIP family metal transporter [Pseudidiomarina sp. 1APP75-32.1]MDN7126814.1 ZIP family metal transporter [Pseudidiomarina sp. 1APR75-33.1]MDN7129069.1 ZIP family metal transporter [Pseudidiomarina sp. 1APR75-15]MDN7134667.1 ZIP family metal transporter [Pseudidiomarina sp. 1ASP75-5]MDN7136663.1 ZIP family metal transporter [Pseudidiomarina sp. 1ASP75-14]
MDLVLTALIASFLTGALTSVGALPVLLGRKPSERFNDTLLGFAAGVMLAASFFSLIVPSIEISTLMYGEGPTPALIAVCGILLGAAAIAALDRLLPHEHFITGPEGLATDKIAGVWLFVFAIAIHNFPEGLAVGVAYGSGDVDAAFSLALGIGLQNIPEGLAVAVGLVAVGYSHLKSFVVASLTGLIEPIGGVIGGLFVNISQVLLPWGLVFAAGAMLFVISHEIIPETHRRGHHQRATAGLMVGLVIMLFLDVWLAA